MVFQDKWYYTSRSFKTGDTPYLWYFKTGGATLHGLPRQVVLYSVVFQNRWYNIFVVL